MIRCTSCKKHKMTSKFPRSDKIGGRGARCHNCRRSKSQEQRAIAKLQALAGGNEPTYPSFAGAANMGMDTSQQTNWGAQAGPQPVMGPDGRPQQLTGQQPQALARPRPTPPSPPRRRPAGGFVAILVSLLALAAPSQAKVFGPNGHTHMHPAAWAGEWIANDFSACCGKSDCVEIPETAIHDNQDGTYTVLQTKEVVPSDQIEATKDGSIWWCHNPTNLHTYCLFVFPKGS